MILSLFVYLGALFVLLWGVLHLVQTPAVVMRFGSLSDDSRRIATMAWVAAGIALVFIALLVAGITYLDPTSPVGRVGYAIATMALVALAVVSLFTTFHLPLMIYKIEPMLLIIAAMLIAVGGLL